MSGATLAPRRPWRGRRVLLGVTGGIAAYKAAQLARDLTQLGAAVDVVLTRSAREFIGPITFEGLTGRAVRGDLLAPGSALDHIRLARECDVICVAPATADFMARAAAGRADDLLTAVLLATRAPVLLCPAMNDRMWAHAQTQANAAHLETVLGYTLVGPAVGPLAFDEGEGPGRMEDARAIAEHIGRALEADSPLSGRRVVVTAGPSREAIDPVRFISNRSSGRMGYALASAAWRRSPDVVLISGPAALEPPVGPLLRDVRTAEDFEREVRAALPADALIMSAAIADFRPAQVAGGKIKKRSAPDALRLAPAVDVLQATRSDRRPGTVVVGFALETDDVRSNARAKLEGKDLDIIVVNDARAEGAGFEVDTNQIVILDRAGGEEQLPLLSKDEVAEAILDRITPLLSNRS